MTLTTPPKFALRALNMLIVVWNNHIYEGYPVHTGSTHVAGVAVIYYTLVQAHIGFHEILGLDKLEMDDHYSCCDCATCVKGAPLINVTIPHINDVFNALRANLGGIVRSVEGQTHYSGP